MGENSDIGWTDHTHNPWRGCTPLGPGCDTCYAMARDLRFESGKNPTEPAHFGSGKPRIRAAEHTRNEPYRIARKLRDGLIPAGQNKMFALSLGDFADNEVDDSWRTDFWKTVRETPELRWLLVTKRAGNVLKMVPADWRQNFRHCGVIITTVDQDELDRDGPKLREIKKVTSWVGLSIEPQIGPVDIAGCADFLDWVIGGGDSRQMGKEPRLYDLDWARALIRQCDDARIAYFQKQCGANPRNGILGMYGFNDMQAGADINEWPADIRVQQFPEALR